MLAALGVFGTGAAWPDLVVAAVMGLLALGGAWTVLRQARSGPRRHSKPVPAPAGMTIAATHRRRHRVR